MKTFVTANAAAGPLKSPSTHSQLSPAEVIANAVAAAVVEVLTPIVRTAGAANAASAPPARPVTAGFKLPAATDAAPEIRGGFPLLKGD